MINKETTSKFFYDKKNWIIIVCVVAILILLSSTCSGYKKYEKSITEKNAEKVAKTMDSINKILVKDSIKRNKHIKELDKNIAKKDENISKLKSDLNKNLNKIYMYKQSEITKNLNTLFKVSTIVAIDSSQIKISNDVGKQIIASKLEQESCDQQLEQERSKMVDMDNSAKLKDSTYNDLKQQFRNAETKSAEKDRVNLENKDSIKKLEKSVARESNAKSFWKTTTGIAILAILAVSILK